MSQQAPPPILCHTANVANVGSSAVLVTAGHCSHDEAIPGPMVTAMGTRFYHITQCRAGYRVQLCIHAIDSKLYLVLHNAVYIGSNLSAMILSIKMFFGDQ